MSERKLSYAEAANAALRRALTYWPEALVFGEDVGKPGGVFGVTKGLRKQFGDRVFDTPISESAILGAAVGSAMMGRRPIVEIMWADFLLVAFDQLVNQAANVRYVSRGRLAAPLTVRTQQGSAPGACAQHSQSLEALLTHIPGLRVAMPATAQDAYDILLAAIACDDPTIVIENRTLYHAGKEGVTLDGPIEPIGGARTVRAGDAVTVVTWGAMLHRVLDAADQLAERDRIDVEVIDARWLAPFDTTTVVASAQRTGRLAVAHEAVQTGGIGAEVVARVVEAGVRLAAPPIRIAAVDSRIPAAPTLASALIPDADLIARRLRALAGAP
jgi:pyruvate dehydrogenase E1 component beta subunit